MVVYNELVAGTAGAGLLGFAWFLSQLIRGRRIDSEGWAAFFGRPEVVKVLLGAGSEVNQRNKHGLTPLGCAVGGTLGRWQKFSSASIDDWRRAAELLRSQGGQE